MSAGCITISAAIAGACITYQACITIHECITLFELIMAKIENKREPQDPYECWCMPCGICVYWDEEKQDCTHPEKYNL